MQMMTNDDACCCRRVKLVPDSNSSVGEHQGQLGSGNSFIGQQQCEPRELHWCQLRFEKPVKTLILIRSEKSLVLSHCVSGKVADHRYVRVNVKLIGDPFLTTSYLYFISHSQTHTYARQEETHGTRSNEKAPPLTRKRERALIMVNQ